MTTTKYSTYLTPTRHITTQISTPYPLFGPLPRMKGRIIATTAQNPVTTHTATASAPIFLFLALLFTSVRWFGVAGALKTCYLTHPYTHFHYINHLFMPYTIFILPFECDIYTDNALKLSSLNYICENVIFIICLAV